MASDLLVRPALELAELVRSGAVPASELVDTALRRADDLGPVLNAFVRLDADAAMRDAAGVRPGDPRPFAGVPIAVKDSVAQAGVPCRVGSALLRDYRPTADSATVTRLRRAGFVIIGRTAMPELGILPTTEPRLTGITRNPWDLSRTPGGSSGGAAAAVAAGIVPLAHGGDGGGSLRIPAACCGLIGLKPSRGRISAGPQLGDDPLVVEGVLTRDVADAAALLDVLAGYEPGDATWAPPPAEPFLDHVRRSRQQPPTGLRIGLALTPPVPADVDPGCVRATLDAARLLEDLGHRVDEARIPPFDEGTRRAFDDIWAVLAAEGVRGGEALIGRPAAPADMEPLTWALYQQARGIDALALRQAVAEIQRAARAIVTAALRYDALLTPALAGPPVAVGAITGWLEPDPLQALVLADRFSPYTAVWNMTGQPALTIPLRLGEHGLPVAVQLVGPPAGETVLLGLAAQLEDARVWTHARTIPPALGR